MLDAYAVRKAIPRVLIAVIGINLSIYICVAIVDIVNVVAGGMAGLIVSPFGLEGMTDFEVDTDPANAIVAGVGIAVGAGPMVAATTAAFTAIATGGISVVLSALGAILWLLMPLILLALAILVTVVIRQALLFFLIIVSPIAIVCYILPGTEKYFSKWWDLFFKTLLVYPIIALIFALSDVFASIIMTTNTGGLTGVAKIITAIIVIYAPLFLIPFAFRFAGGAMAQLTKVATGVGDKMSQSGFVKQRREYYGQKHKDNMLRGRAEAYRRSDSVASDTNRSRARRAAAGWRAKKLSGYRADIYDREAELNERMAKATAATSGSGDDTAIRAYSVNKEVADAARRDGRGEGELWRTTSSGGLEYRTAGGAWTSENAVKESRRKYGNRNVSQLQQSMAYEMKKASTQEQQDSVASSFAQTADSWGMSENQANGAWIGAGFANQDHNLQLKHARWERDESTGKMMMKANESSIIKEMDEKKGAYEAGRNNADTWTTMSMGVKKASDGFALADQTVKNLESKNTSSLNPDELVEHNQKLSKAREDRATHSETLQRAARVVDSIRTVQPEVGADGKPTGSGKMIESIGAGAAGRTKEEMRAFAKITDQYAGKYTEQRDDYGAGQPAAPPRPAGHVEEAIYNRTDGRDTKTK